MKLWKVISIFIVVSLLITIVYINFTIDNVIATVSDKERIVNSNSDGVVSSKYLIFTDKETFENTDALVLFKFNSSDVYGQIKIGETYDFKVYGFRIPMFSMYRNIISFKELIVE